MTRCYPGRPASGRGDRTPTPEEQRLCERWRDEELRLLKPGLVVTVGGLAARRLLGVRSVGESVGVRYELDGAVAIPLPHPSGASSWLNAAREPRARRGRGRTRSAQSWHDCEARYPQRVTQAPRYRTTFVRLLGFLRPYKLSTAISVVLAIGSQAAALIGVYLTGSVANALTKNERGEIPWLDRGDPRARRRAGGDDGRAAG